MWCQSSSESTTTTPIPPNLLKNFNVYEVLEPEKKGAKNREETNVEKLIDIDDCSQDSGFQDSDLNASFLDNNRDFDLVDLYQNIFVTPQHIKQNVASGVVTNFASNVLDIDFKQFFDKLESGQNIDCTQAANFKEENVSKCDYDVLLEKPRVLVPNVLTEPDVDPEDLINEVLTQKNIEKRILQEIHPSDIADISKSKTKSDLISDYSHTSLNNSFSKDSKFESIFIRNMASSFTKQCPIDRQINNSLTFTVRAMQKDEKVYKKKRLVKPENQTSRFTKGPDINEKSVVLPQIMARVMARQEYLDDINSQKKRLLLDAGEKFVKIDSQGISNSGEKQRHKENSGVGTNVVNSDRSSTLKEAKLCMNKATESIAVHNTVITCVNCNKKTENGILGTKSVRLDCNPTLSYAKLNTNKATASFAVNTAKTTTNSNNPSVKGSFGGVTIQTDKRFGANCNIPSVSKEPSAFGANSIKTDKGFGKVSPKVLMADCNKERLRALKQSQMFKNFVLNGKFEL